MSKKEIQVPKLAELTSEEHPEGTYALTIENVYLVDIQGTIDDDNCAEVYGSVSVIQAGKTFTYFTAPQKSPVRVCEKDAPLNRGKQVGDLPKNGNWDNKNNNMIMLKGAPATTGWVLQAELYDDDSTSKDDLICKGSSELLRPGSGFSTGGVWACEGQGKLVVEWKITDIAGRDAGLRLLENDNLTVHTKLPDFHGL
ncbi:hypothetical protein ABZ318_26685 [Streptomyces sp. NPDC006197]|uniref:hypothetical protein n=1 Tax=Streptomyces sp. NPDC006197 TaxID=3156685 RepID=UPI00339E5CED